MKKRFLENRVSIVFFEEIWDHSGGNDPFVSFQYTIKFRKADDHMENGCREYRKWMVLLGLRKQLKNSRLDPERKKALKRKIQKLEKELEIA